MRCKLSLFAVCCCLLVLGACSPRNSASYANARVAFIDYVQIVEESEAGIRYKAYVEAGNTLIQERFAKDQKSSSNANFLQGKIALYQEAMNNVQTTANQAIEAHIKESASAVCVIHGFDGIFSYDSVVGMHQGLDVTSLVVAAMDTKNLEFPDLEAEILRLEQELAEGMKGVGGIGGNKPKPTRQP